MTPVSSLAGAPALAPKAPSEREKLASAARQFEAIFVRQMLAAARAADFGKDDVFGKMDQTFVQMRDERFAEIASQTGALGLAAQIERHLAGLLPRQTGAAGET
ncbi:MAG: flagellar biosynthesis protein FlgJ [Novosphingobium sp.]